MDHPLDKEFQHILDTGFFAPGFDPGPGPDAGRNYRSGLLSRPFAAYAAEVLRYPEGYFDVIVVDGMARVLTAWLGSERVKENGFILFDNSDREDYAAGYALLERAGRQILHATPGAGRSGSSKRSAASTCFQVSKWRCRVWLVRTGDRRIDGAEGEIDRSRSKAWGRKAAERQRPFLGTPSVAARVQNSHHQRSVRRHLGNVG